jgi:hypothetical protein
MIYKTGHDLASAVSNVLSNIRYFAKLQKGDLRPTLPLFIAYTRHNLCYFHISFALYNL